ncbi:hypothetical protein AGMMS49546_22590 [Spirochaetia bacterium]|nr:hypothetical protein AGMMS49546_22590 [Spirochaetia bacterium]
MRGKSIRTGAAMALAAVFFVFGASGAFALDVGGTAPKTGDSTLNGIIDTAWTEAMGQIRKEVGGINGSPENFIRSWGDASIFSSHGATQRGYGVGKHFTFTIGPMVGFRLGSGIDGVEDYIRNVDKKLNKEGDITLGANVQAITGQVNVNMSRWLLDGLDLGLKFGMFKLNIENIEFNNWSIGLLGNYQIIKEKNLAPHLFKWRGLKLGTGVIYQDTRMGFSMKLNPITQPLSVYGVSVGNMKIDPKVAFNMTTQTVTIPLEATTAVHLLSFLNLTLGLGADIGFGKNDMKLGVEGDVRLDTTYVETTPGSLTVSAGGAFYPTAFNPKIMTGIGLNIGPVIFDVPVTLYFPGFKDGIGVNAGVTFGLSF